MRLGQPIGAGQHRVVVDRSDGTDILLGAWPEGEARAILERIAGAVSAGHLVEPPSQTAIPGIVRGRQ